MSDSEGTHPNALVSEIRAAIARHPDAVGWIIESSFRAAYENCAVCVKSVKLNNAPLTLVDDRLWKIGGLPIYAETKDDAMAQTWGTLVGNDGVALATILTDRPKSFIRVDGAK